MEWHGLSLRISGESPLHPQKTRENHGATARITSRSVKHGLGATRQKCRSLAGESAFSQKQGLTADVSECTLTIDLQRKIP